jgi:hypothetical protein
MRFVPIKTIEQQGCLVLHRARHLLVRQQTATINSIRAYLAEFGIVAPVGRRGVEQLLEVVADTNDARAPEMARACIFALGVQLRALKAQVLELDRRSLGGRTSHRLCLDHPDRVAKVCILDNLPNYHVWTHVDKKWAINDWHWTFLAQPEPLPETLLNAVSAEWYLKGRRSEQKQPPKIVFDEYVRCFTKKTITGSCRDYRAGATWMREGVVDDRDDVVHDVGIGLVEIDLLFNDGPIVLGQRDAGGFDRAWTLEVAGLNLERVEAAAAVSIRPVSDRIAREARFFIVRKFASVRIDTRGMNASKWT